MSSPVSVIGVMTNVSLIRKAAVVFFFKETGGWLLPKRKQMISVHQNHVLPQKPSALNLNSDVFKIQDINVSEPMLLATKKY